MAEADQFLNGSKNQMFALFNAVTIAQIESAKLVFEILFVVSGIGVVTGVAIEKERFDLGWKLLVISLGLDVIFTINIFSADALISERQRSEIISLQKKIAPRRLSIAEQQAIAAALVKFKGQNVRVSTYAGDAEGSSLGSQIVAALHAGNLNVESALASVLPLGGFAAGVFVSGSDKELTDAVGAALEKEGHLSVIQGTGFFRGNISSSAPAAMPPAQVMVGVKPVEIIETIK